MPGIDQEIGCALTARDFAGHDRGTGVVLGMAIKQIDRDVGRLQRVGQNDLPGVDTGVDNRLDLLLDQEGQCFRLDPLIILGLRGQDQSTGAAGRPPDARERGRSLPARREAVHDEGDDASRCRIGFFSGQSRHTLIAEIVGDAFDPFPRRLGDLDGRVVVENEGDSGLGAAGRARDVGHRDPASAPYPAYPDCRRLQCLHHARPPFPLHIC